jgi:hypothetical protein
MHERHRGHRGTNDHGERRASSHATRRHLPQPQSSGAPGTGGHNRRPPHRGPQPCRSVAPDDPWFEALETLVRHLNEASRVELIVPHDPQHTVRGGP